MNYVTHHTLTVGDSQQIIFKRLHFVCPDLSIDGTPTLIWSKEDADEWNEQEKTRYKIKPLNHYPYLKSKVRLRVDDLLQNYTVIINLQDEQVDSKINDGLFYLLEIRVATKTTTTTTTTTTMRNILLPIC